MALRFRDARVGLNRAEQLVRQIGHVILKGMLRNLLDRYACSLSDREFNMMAKCECDVLIANFTSRCDGDRQRRVAPSLPWQSEGPSIPRCGTDANGRDEESESGLGNESLK
jgi:hypothetical protein